MSDLELYVLKSHSSWGSTQWHSTNIFFSLVCLKKQGEEQILTTAHVRNMFCQKRRIFKRLELLSRRSDIWSKQLSERASLKPDLRKADQPNSDVTKGTKDRKWTNKQQATHSTRLRNEENTSENYKCYKPFTND